MLSSKYINTRRIRNTMLTIVGTSHIARESVQEVDRAIRTKKPDIVAVELDRKRMHGLLKGGNRGMSISQIRQVGLKGWMFGNLGGWVERKLGSKVGVSPGSDMLQAYRTARELKIKVALVDQDITVTLKKLSKSITWRERWNFLVDIIKGVFGKSIKMDLSKVPDKEIVKKLIQEMKSRYPSLYRVLVEERNKYMARRLAILMKKHPDKHILAVMGAGHEKEVRKEAQSYLNKIDVAQ
mgnify:CR=1 FL=1